MYETEEGRVPFSDWMDRMEHHPIYEIVMKRLDKVEKGTLGDHKYVGDGVTELRIDYGQGYRIYFGRDGAELVILLVAGDKDSQARDIKRAKTYWEDYCA